MIVHPQFDPIFFSIPIPGIGSLPIRWYALGYITGFILFVILGRIRIKKGTPFFTNERLDDFLTWGVLGVILGGRLGYVLFYKPDYFLHYPLEIFKIWDGGMSFHGGFLGVLAAMWLFAYKNKQSFWNVADFIAPLVPLGLLFGRMGNFINGELWGRVTHPNAWWAMGFPQAQHADQIYISAHIQWLPYFQQYHMLPRHPSQIYQALLEGLCLFILLWIFSSKKRPTGQVAAFFLTGYGIFRFIAEFAREPDDFLGLLQFGLSMGQWLSLPMILLGIGLFIYFGKKNRDHQEKQ